MLDRSTLNWRKSAYSGGEGGNCVEIAELPHGGRAVRDTKDRGNGPILCFTATQWSVFTAGLRAGEFD